MQLGRGSLELLGQRQGRTEGEMTGRRGFRFPTSAALLAAVLSLAFFAPGAVPSPWTDADVGGPGQAGNATYDNTNGTWVLTGGGWDVWATADAFNYAYMPVN